MVATGSIFNCSSRVLVPKLITIYSQPKLLFQIISMWESSLLAEQVVSIFVRKVLPCIFEYITPWIIDNIITRVIMLLYNNKGCTKYDVYAQFQGWSNVLMLSPAREIVALRIKSIVTKFTLNDKVIFIYITIYHHITIAIDNRWLHWNSYVLHIVFVSFVF